MKNNSEPNQYYRDVDFDTDLDREATVIPFPQKTKASEPKQDANPETNDEKSITPHDLVLEYIRRGWNPVPIPFMQKGPKGQDWDKQRTDLTNVNSVFPKDRQWNVGVQLGQVSGNLVDTDLDCPEALSLASWFFPPTQAVFGRPATPWSHALYNSPELVAMDKAAIQFKDPEPTDGEKGMLIELRCGGGGKGAQTVFPGSVHPSGQPITWATFGEPATVSGEVLLHAVKQTAAACLLVRGFPGPGLKHDAALVLAGFLVRLGWDEHRVTRFLVTILQHAGANPDAVICVPPAFERFQNGEPLAGFPRVKEIYGEKRAKKIAEWLGYQEKAQGTSSFFELPDPEGGAYDFSEVKAKILAGGKADAIKIWASLLGSFTPNAIERAELVHLLSERVNAGIADTKVVMRDLECEWTKRQNEKAFAEKRAASKKVYEPFDYPDAEAGPVMRKWDEICCAVESIEPPIRDANNWPVHVNRTDIPDMHVLSSMTANGGEDSTLPAPKNFLLKSHDRFSLELELGDYVTFFTVNPVTGQHRIVAPNGRFVDHFLHYGRSNVPKVYTVMTMPIVLANRTILNRNGLDRDRHLVLRIDSEMAKYIPEKIHCTPEAVLGAYRFLRDDWLCDVLADAEGKAILIAFALSIIERCLFPARPAFFISAGLRGGGKTTAFNMISMAVLGEQTAARAWSNASEERRKSLLAVLMTGVPCITWDNITSGSEIHCAHLERAITSEVYADRKLGETEDILAPAYSIMSFTGNNIQPHDDMASRSLVVNLATDRPDPENREFKRSDPVGWTRQHRGEILAIAHVLIPGGVGIGQELAWLRKFDSGIAS
jgi:hypothetical protein